MRYILQGAPVPHWKTRKIFSVNVKPRRKLPLSELGGKLFDKEKLQSAVDSLEMRGDKTVVFSKQGKPYVIQKSYYDPVVYAPRRVWTSVTFLAREFFRTSFNTRTNPGELEALMLMQKAPKDRQMGHALRIKSMFQARLLIDSGAITEDGANAHIHTVANLVDKGPYGKDRY